MVTFRNESGKLKHDCVNVWPAEVKDGDLRNLLHKNRRFSELQES